MSGTREGGLKAAKKNLMRNPDHFRRIGKIGGIKGTTGGFASYVVGDDGLTGRERAHVAGKKGGSISKRVSKKLLEVK